jgi:hypothetical protein
MAELSINNSQFKDDIIKWKMKFDKVNRYKGVNNQLQNF